jgi:PTH1 family peptidyl-tRNA hydrolase
MKLVVGLGNPGDEYKYTRHNIGFMTLDYFPGNNLKWKNKFNGLYCEDNIDGEKVIFLKPLTYMNLSGDCVIQFVNFYKISNEDILIIQDDLDMPYLKYKIKFKSSSGGHNGIKSILNNLKTDSVPRLKIGIAHNRQIDTKDYVLGKITSDDIKLFNDSCDIFRDIILDFIKYDINYCMQKYNRK